MTLLDALILGIVEGVTEFLPVSSTGHLILTQRALGLEDTSAADAYAICIQAGAIVAVLGLYRARVAQMVRGLLGRDPAGLRLAACIVLAFVPAAVCGLSFSDVIKAHLFGLWPVVGAWFVGGLVILAFRRRMVAGSRSIEAASVHPLHFHNSEYMATFVALREHTPYSFNSPAVVTAGRILLMAWRPRPQTATRSGFIAASVLFSDLANYQSLSVVVGLE